MIDTLESDEIHRAIEELQREIARVGMAQLLGFSTGDLDTAIQHARSAADRLEWVGNTYK